MMTHSALVAVAPTLPTRHQLLLLLSTPRCARELRERILGSSRKRIESALHRLALDRLVVCVTPELKQSRMYQRTVLGQLLAKELGSGRHSEPAWVFSLDELRLRAWVQAGRYRREVLRVMAYPATPKQLRKAANRACPRFGANHVHKVLRDFDKRGIARRFNIQYWRLTPLGERFRHVELEELSQRVIPVEQSWRPIEAPIRVKLPPFVARVPGSVHGDRSAR